MILRLKRTPGIYLVGFMGCGKTTTGRLLGDALGWRFVDLDDDIVAAASRPINEIFDELGEETFRRYEMEMLLSRVDAIRRGLPTVLALGGGAFAQPANYRLVSENGVSVWLDCPAIELWRRVERESHRPLARDRDRFHTLYEARRAAYAQADFRIDVAGLEPDEAIVRILALPIF